MKSSDYSYTLYKLIVLYALSRVEHPLTKSQIADFILTRDYTDYLTLQTVFSQLADAGFTQEKQIRNRTQLMLTKEGQNTLQLFSNELTAEIRHDIDEYLTEHAASLKNTAAVTSDYHLAADGGYLAELSLRENNRLLLSVSLNIPTEALARGVCEKWESAHEELYGELMKRLL